MWFDLNSSRAFTFWGRDHETKMGVPFPPLGSPPGTLIFWGFEIHPYFEVFIKTLPCFPWVLGGPKGNVDEILLRIHRYTICSCNILYIYTVYLYI